MCFGEESILHRGALLAAPTEIEFVDISDYMFSLQKGDFSLALPIIGSIAGFGFLMCSLGYASCSPEEPPLFQRLFYSILGAIYSLGFGIVIILLKILCIAIQWLLIKMFTVSCCIQSESILHVEIPPSWDNTLLTAGILGV